jgi:predicted dienelactone hydrolase
VISQDDLERYLHGFRENDGALRDIQDLLANPAAVPIVQVSVPDNTKLYGALAGKKVSIPYYVAYPTTPENQREAYLFPFKAAHAPTFVHLERMGDEPLPAKARARYPVIVSAHGAYTHPAWDINRAKVLASHGFFVVMPFYGDGRFAPLGANDLPLRALRSLATKVLLDQLLNESPYAKFVDADRIGVAGYSLGGVTALSLLGAQLDLNVDTISDPRIRAGVGSVPYTGSNENGSESYQFGPNNVGVRAITKPFLCIYGSNDTVATPRFILPAMAQLRGPRYVVEFVNQPHVFTGEFWSDRENWEILFFRAYLQDDARALALLEAAECITGFGDDRQHFELQQPSAE